MSLFRLSLVRLPAAPSRCLRTFATSSRLANEAPQGTVLPRLQADLKTALRSKDKLRLTVLRSLLAEITNASKTPKPIANDTHLLALLQKTIASSNKAIDEFEAAKRQDLVDKEKAQVDVLEGYVDEIPKLGADEVDSIIKDVVEGFAEGERKFGRVMKEVARKIAGRPADMQEVTRRIKEMVPEK
ncbi:GatB/YqeY domain-containing protein [Polyplosphaeria fusca]|uniref:Altered inheritance of mitochondria protein 41 n=1 Tax=Polyplosphaeria fusca TaxID=682080 RepID=A0A9P4QVN5_9PLEO|nr:GatB/YqeY domain-containing protein [Polyplosphaeria fusca]